MFLERRLRGDSSRNLSNSMNNLAIYRKYRPQKFSEIVGQEEAVRILANAVKTEKISHAYIFAGPRGTGKTTAARVFAKALNCEHLTNQEPCNKCSTCIAINKNKFLDLVEIDAASNRGIDEVRHLQEEIRLGPTYGRYKVFILDEAHMLTTQASNALLKSLEEPPENTVFILATTEPHKILPTILSRCQRLNFKNIALDILIGKLKRIASAEKVDVDARTLKSIAVNAKGSLRDAESMLDKILSLEKRHITLEDARKFIGIIDEHLVMKMIDFISKNDLAGALKFVNKLSDKGIDFKAFLMVLVDYMRKILVTKVSGDLVEIFQDELTEEEKDVIRKYSEVIPYEKGLELVDAFIEASGKLELYPAEQMSLEFVLIRFLK